MGLFSQHTFGLDEHSGDSFINKINDFKADAVISEDPEKEFSKLGKIVNEIFTKALGIHYKFTYEDLKYDAKEVSPEKTHDLISKFCDMMNLMEFDKEKINSENLAKAADGLIDLINVFKTLTTGDRIPKDILKEEREYNKESKEFERLLAKLDEDSPEEKKQGLFSRFFKKEKNAEPKKVQEEIEKKLPSFEEKEEDTNSIAESAPEIKDEILEIKEPEDIKVPVKEEQDLVVPEYKEEIAEPESGFSVGKKKDISSKPKEKNITKSKKISPKKTGLPHPEKLKKKESLKKTSISKRTSEKIHKTQPKKKAHLKKVSKPSLKSKELPKFELPKVSKIDLKREERFRQNLTDIIKNLERGKSTLKEEIGTIESEEKILKKEKAELEKRDKERPLPAFKILEKNLDSEISGLEKKKNELLKKEEHIEKKLEAIGIMEKNLKELSKKLGKDEKAVKEERRYIESKKKVIDDINKDIKKTYAIAIKEIEKVREELRDKEEKFNHLKEFYISRENILSHREENLLNEKRRYAKLVSGLLQEHIVLAMEDLKKTDDTIERLKKKELEIDTSIKEYQEKYKKLIEEKDGIKKELEEKKEYFRSVEEEFRQKDPAFEQLELKIARDEEGNIAKEVEIKNFEKSIQQAKDKYKNKLKSIELRELDLRSIEKDAERIRFEIHNKEIRLDIREKELNKRIDSYNKVREDIQRNINREKASIRRLEKKLQARGIVVSRKLNKLEESENHLESYKKSVLDISQGLKDDEEHVSREINVSTVIPDLEMGHPAVLDILRLLNIGKDFIRNGQTARARDTYLEIQRLFEELDENSKEEIYGEILEVFRPRENDFLANLPQGTSINAISSNENIDSLIQKFQYSIDSGDLGTSQEIYSRIQRKYEILDQEEKDRYYSQIMQLYNKILSTQVQTGAV